MALVYIHKRKDIDDPFLSVFYVGIGIKKNRAYSEHNRNKYWKNIVHKHGYYVEITHNDIIRQDAICIEKYLISFYGRKDLFKGNLVNMTDGGEGALGTKGISRFGKDNPMYGKKHTEETKKLFTEQRSGSKNTRYCKKISENLRKINSLLMTERNKHNNPNPKGSKRTKKVIDKIKNTILNKEILNGEN